MTYGKPDQESRGYKNGLKRLRISCSIAELRRLEALTQSTASGPVFEGGVEKTHSELALGEVEGVNPE